MTKISRMLCAVDSSAPAQVAFRHALALSRAGGAELAVVVAVPPSEPFNRRARERIAKIAALRRAATAAAVRMRVSVQHGDPAGVILLHAHSRNCDLIVLGTHRRTGLARLRSGSVAEQVARRASCPVLVVPAERHAGKGTLPGAFHQVVCPVDLSAPSNAALEQALRVVASGRSRWTMMYALSAPDPMGRYAYHITTPEYGKLLRREAWQRLQESVPPTLKASTHVRARVVAGRPAEEILKLARELDADLIAMGVTSRGVIGRRVFASTAVRVMRSATCPVLVVPDRMRESTPLDMEDAARDAALPAVTAAAA